MKTAGREGDPDITSESLDAVEFPWQLEAAVDARAVHDNQLTADEMDDPPKGADGPGYAALAVLMRARLNAE